MQKPMSSRALRIRIILFELLSTQALITSVKTLYLLHFLMQNGDIASCLRLKILAQCS